MPQCRNLPGQRHQAIRRRRRNGGRRPVLRGRHRGGRGARRSIRVRQDHHTQDDQPARGTDVGDDHGARRRPTIAAGPRTPSEHRVRDPADRPVSPSNGSTQHRGGARVARLGSRSDRRTLRRTRRPGGTRAGPARSVPGGALGWPATTRRRGACAGGRSSDPADGRAVQRGRSDRSRAGSRTICWRCRPPCTRPSSS